MRTVVAAFAVVAPIVLGLALFELLAPFYGGVEGAFSSLAGEVTAEGFPAGAFTLVTLIAIQIFVALAAAAYAAGMIWTTPGAPTAFYYALALSLAVVLVAIFWYAATLPLSAMAYSFRLIEDFFASTSLRASWTEPLYGGGFFTPLRLVYLIPGGVAALAVSTVTLAAHAQVASFLNAERGNYGVDQSEAETRLRLSLYLLAILLIVSMLLISTFLHLPSQLAGLDGDAATATAAEAVAVRLANELTTFWGVIFALANLVAIGIPFLLIHFHRRKLTDPLDGAARIFGFDDFIGFDFKTVVERLLLFASPLLAAQSSNFLNNLALFRPFAQ